MAKEDEIKFRKLELGIGNFLRIEILKKLLFVAIIIAFVGLVVGGYFFYQYQKIDKEFRKFKNESLSQKDPQEEVKKLVSEVGKLIDLPSDELPVVATITSIEKLKDQVLFKKAKNGDKVLIYTLSKMAIVYDPARRKIVETGPVTLDSSIPEDTRLVLRNGTTTKDLANKIAEDIKKKFPQLEDIDKDNAAKDSYDKSIMVVLSEEKRNAATILSQALDIAIGDLPKDEPEPKEAEILIILGKDQVGS